MCAVLLAFSHLFKANWRRFLPPKNKPGNSANCSGSCFQLNRQIMQHITEISKYLAIAQLAIDLHSLKNAARYAKDAYHEKMDESGGDFDGLDPRNADWADLIEFTKDEYKAHLAAKRKVYNAQRRLDTACRKVAV